MLKFTTPIAVASLMLTSLTLVGCAKTNADSAQADTVMAQLLKNHPIAIQKITEGVWVHSSAYRFPGGQPIPSNGLIVEDGESLILVDTAWGEVATLALLETIKTDIGKPVKKLIITHHHYDRLAGVDILEAQGVQVFSHPLTPALSAALGTPTPDTSVSALAKPKSRSKVGPVEIAFPGKGHSPDNIVVYVPAAKVLFAGGLVRGGEQATLGNLADADIEHWPEALAWVRATHKDAKFVVPAHGKGGGNALPERTLKLLAATVNAKNSTPNKKPKKTKEQVKDLK